MSRFVNQLYAAAPAAVAQGAASDEKEWILKEHGKLMDSLRKYRESGDKLRLKARIEAMDAVHKFYIDRQDALVQLEELKTNATMEASALDVERFKAVIRGFNDIEAKTTASQNRIVDQAKNILSTTGSPMEAWKFALDSMGSEEIINEDSVYLPEMMDDLTRILVGKAWLDEDDLSTDYDDSSEAEAYELIRRYDVRLADEYRTKMNMSRRVLNKQGRYRSWLDKTNQSLAKDIQTLEQMESGKYDGKKEEALSQLNQLTGNLNTALQSVSSVSSVGEAAQASMEAKEELLESDAYHKAMSERSDYLWEQYTGRPDSSSQRDKIAEIVGSPKFKWWAESNNLKLGTVTFDENGRVKSYSMGPHDMIAIYKYNRQLQREKDPAVPLWRPKELAQISYREEVGQPEVFAARTFDANGNRVTLVKVDTWDKEPKYYQQAGGRYVEVPAPEGVEFRALAKDIDGDGNYDEYTSASELRLGSNELPPGEPVLPDETGNFPVMKPVQTAYVELLAPEAGDAVGSKRVRTADGREVYIPPENLASYQILEQGRKERRKDKRQSGTQGRQPGEAAGEGGEGGGGGGRGGGKSALEPWKMYSRRRLQELEGDPVAVSRKEQEGLSDREAEFTDAMPEEFEVAAGKIPRALRREQEKTERSLGSARPIDRGKVTIGTESEESIQRKQNFKKRNAARQDIPEKTGEDLPDQGKLGATFTSEPVPEGINIAKKRSGIEAKHEAWKQGLRAQQGATDIGAGATSTQGPMLAVERPEKAESREGYPDKDAPDIRPESRDLDYKPPTMSIPTALKKRPQSREELLKEMENKKQQK